MTAQDVFRLIAKSKRRSSLALLVLLALFFLLDSGRFQTDTARREALPQEPSHVVRVVDGDTVRVTLDGNEETVRLIGINSPESVDPRRPVECFGKEASQYLRDMVEGRTITLESDSTQSDRDKYGRLLRYVFLDDGTDVNRRMIEDGYAYEYTYDASYRYQAAFKEAQRTAREERRGLWASETCNGEK